MGVKASHLKWWSMIPLFIGFAYIFPRILISTLGPNDPWTSYLYLYGFGFFYTGSGVLLALKSGAVHLSRSRDRYWFKVVIFGFFYFAALHGIWILLALNIPYLGGQ